MKEGKEATKEIAGEGLEEADDDIPSLSDLIQ
jgi:hypothetical protein